MENENYMITEYWLMIEILLNEGENEKENIIQTENQFMIENEKIEFLRLHGNDIVKKRKIKDMMKKIYAEDFGVWLLYYRKIEKVLFNYTYIV